MALIICPECGNKISDKAPACPHCGILKADIQAMLNEEKSQATLNVERSQEKRCLFCGAIIDSTSSNCLKCNHPVLCLNSDVKWVEKTLEQNNNPEDSMEISADVKIADEVTHFLVTSAMNTAGKDGPVVIEEAETEDSSIRMTNVMTLDRGLISDDDDTSGYKEDIVIANPAVLIIDKQITKTAEIFDLLEGIKNRKRGLLIVADQISGQALNSVVHYREHYNLAVAAIRAPGYGDRRKAIMKDIAIVTSGDIVSDDYKEVVTYKKAVEKFGHADFIKICQDKTFIIGGHSRKSDIDTRIAEIKKRYEESYSDFDKEKLKERIENLSVHGAVINIGSDDETALEDRANYIEEILKTNNNIVINNITRR